MVKNECMREIHQKYPVIEKEGVAIVKHCQGRRVLLRNKIQTAKDLLEKVCALEKFEFNEYYMLDGLALVGDSKQLNDLVPEVLESSRIFLEAPFWNEIVSFNGGGLKVRSMLRWYESVVLGMAWGCKYNIESFHAAVRNFDFSQRFIQPGYDDSDLALASLVVSFVYKSDKDVAIHRNEFMNSKGKNHGRNKIYLDLLDGVSSNNEGKVTDFTRAWMKKCFKTTGFKNQFSYLAAAVLHAKSNKEYPVSSDFRFHALMCL